MNASELGAMIDTYFGDREGLRLFFAPGRVNLIGEHTDYTGGYVFPAALSLGTWAVISPRQDGRVRFHSLNIPSGDEEWIRYPQAMIQILTSAFPDISQRVKGVDLLYYGTIPNGAGLSSSASLLLVTALAITRLAGFDVPREQLARLAQQAENQYIGVHCGLMDPFVIAMGKRNHAIRLKCDPLQYTYVPIDIAEYQLVITYTNKRRGLADTKYNERRQECEQGLKMIKQHLPHVKRLGDLRYGDWIGVRDAVADAVIRRRIEHVVSENERVQLATDSLQQSDLLTFGQLMKESHQSLRDHYEVTGPELDALYEIASQVDGCIGTRMTGAGFGGCSVSLVERERVPYFKERVAQGYTARTGRVPSFFACEIGDGIREMTDEEADLWRS